MLLVVVIVAVVGGTAAAAPSELSLLQMRSYMLMHQRVKYRYGFVYIQYKSHAWFWEEVVLLHRFLLTSIIIFVKPGYRRFICCSHLIASLQDYCTIGMCVHHQSRLPRATRADASVQDGD